MTKTKNPNYRLWLNMRSNSNAVIDPQWVGDFEAFNAYIGPKPTTHARLVRKDKSLGFIPNNVEWKDSKLDLRIGVNSGMANFKIDESLHPFERMRLLKELLGPVPEALLDKTNVTVKEEDSDMEHLIIESFSSNYASKIKERWASGELTAEEAHNLRDALPEAIEQYKASPDFIRLMQRVQ
jgi:hypothetical protein